MFPHVASLVRQRRDACAGWQVFCFLHIPGQSELFQAFDESEPDVVLPGVQPVASRRGERVMIVVPAFAHRRECCPGDVVRLHRTVVKKPYNLVTRRLVRRWSGAGEGRRDDEPRGMRDVR